MSVLHSWTCFYQRYEDMVAQDPTGHAMDYIHCYLAIEKAGA